METENKPELPTVGSNDRLNADTPYILLRNIELKPESKDLFFTYLYEFMAKHAENYECHWNKVGI